MFECQQWYGWHSLQLLCAPPRQSYSQVTNKYFVPPALYCTLHKGVMIVAVTAVTRPAKQSLHSPTIRGTSDFLRRLLEGNFPPPQPPLSPVLPFPSSIQGQGVSRDSLMVAKTQFEGLISQDAQPRHVPKKPISFPNIASSECLPKSQAPTLLEGAQNKIKTGC